MMSEPEHDKPLLQRLHEQTAQLNWVELQRHFARGSVIVVAPQLDLVRVAAQFAEDDQAGISELLAQNKLHHATDEDAKRWHREQADLWTVVVAPWVIVQDMEPNNQTRK